jgi:60 kDa SS-A/Ro ribonucleoprotein
VTDVLRGFTTRATPQSQPSGRATVKNAAGGHGFAVDDATRLRRFLILGVAGGTFHVGDKELARDNAEVVVRLAKTDAQLLVDTIVEVSTEGRAPKQNPAIFALALAAAEADEAGRAYALAALPKVCRTGTHLYLFVSYAQQFRGWGPAFKRAVANWYKSKDSNKLAYQLLKYRQREGVSHRDVIRLARPAPPSDAHDALFEYLMVNVQGGQKPSPRALDRYGDNAYSPHFTKQVGKTEKWANIPALVPAYLAAQDANAVRATELIAEFGMSWEMLPDRLMNEPLVWEAMLHKGVPQTALIRQLPRLTKLGLTTGQTGALIVKQLTDLEQLKRGRIHPIQALVAQRTYASGRSARGDNTWAPTTAIIDGLHDMFYAAYGSVEPANKITLVATDVSQSMTWNAVGGMPLQALEVCGALALVVANTEPSVIQLGFTTAASTLTISKRQRLDDVLAYIRRQPNGGTDCSLPMLWAAETKTYVDTFYVLTDEETWSGRMHPYQALARYRERMNPNARMVIVGMSPRGYTVADPDDAGTLPVVGFDTNTPQLMTDFSAGRV